MIQRRTIGQIVPRKINLLGLSVYERTHAMSYPPATHESEYLCLTYLQHGKMIIKTVSRYIKGYDLKDIQSLPVIAWGSLHSKVPACVFFSKGELGHLRDPLPFQLAWTFC